MSTTQEAGQHLVLFVAAGDGSDAACEAVAQRLSEKFGTPYERMLASVRQSPRVFKRNLSRVQAESYAALLRSLGAVAEVKNGGDVEKKKPPPPETTDRTCPFCGRALRADGVCVICKPREVDPIAAEASEPTPVVEPTPAVEPDPPLAVETGAVPLGPPQSDPVLDFGVKFQDAAQPESEQEIPADDGLAAPAPAEGIGPLGALDGPGQPVEAGCANCGGLLNQVGQCPACDLGAAVSVDESAAIENDLSALLSPEELGVCPNCCGPMEQDGTCLICPPADPAEQQPAVPSVSPTPTPNTETGPVAAPAHALSELPLDGLLDAPDPMHTMDPTDPGTAMPGPDREQETSPFEPLTPLSAEPEEDGTNVCAGCGGPKGSDGICLICGEDTAGVEPGVPTSANGSAFEEMTVTGNEPPPAEPVATAESAVPAATAKALTTAEEAEPHSGKSPAGKSNTSAPSAAKKPGKNLDLSRFPRALTIPLLATLLLITGGIAMAMAGSFIIASGIWFLALIAGLATIFNGIQHLERTAGSFPKLPKPVIFAFLVFLFCAGSGGIIGYAFKQSVLFTQDKANEFFQAEAARQAGGEGLLSATDAENAEDLESLDSSGQIIMEEEMLERAITAEREGEDNPRAALESWNAYLEGFPDGTRASEARRKVSQWRAVVKRDDALAAAIARDRKGNNDAEARIRDWKSCIATYGNTPAIRAHAEKRIDFWNSMLQQSSAPNFPYWASLRLEDGRLFSGKVVAENDQELKMQLANRMKMNFIKGEFEIIDSDHINGKRVECENMRLVSGVATEHPAWGREDGITILGEDRPGVEAMVPFRVTGFYHFEVLARATRDHGGFPTAILSLNGEQQERIRLDSEDWKLYKVTFPFRIPAGEQRLEIVFPPQYQTMQDKRIVAIDYFTTAMVE